VDLPCGLRILSTRTRNPAYSPGFHRVRPLVCPCRSEFIAGCGVVGIGGLSHIELEGIFAEIDDNGGGFVLFDEFCSWCAAHHYGEVEGLSEQSDEDHTAGPESPTKNEESASWAGPCELL
jgi:hypothetical protein